MNSIMTNSFECGFCLDTKEELGVRVGNDVLCTVCYDAYIQPKFQSALEYESQWPVRWGSATLGPQRMSEAFVDLWHAKCKEYETPYVDRVYCPHEHCKHFVGTRSEQSELEEPVSRCNECGGLRCRGCGVALQSPSQEHTCVVQDEAAKDREAFTGQVRGKDYQLCPGAGCGIKVSLTDGCNHMICKRCLTSFCYICGVEASGGGNHWRRQEGGCPRYHHPDHANNQDH